MRVLLAAGLLVLVTGTAGCGSPASQGPADDVGSTGRVTGTLEVRPGAGTPVTAVVRQVGLFTAPTAPAATVTGPVGRDGGFSLRARAGRWWLTTVPPLPGTGRWVTLRAGAETGVRLLVRPEGNPR